MQQNQYLKHLNIQLKNTEPILLNPLFINLTNTNLRIKDTKQLQNNDTENNKLASRI